MELRLLTGEEVRQCLGMARAIELMGRAFSELSQGRVTVPLRTRVDTSDGTLLYKPALANAAGFCCLKAVSVFPGNVARRLPATTGLLLLNDVHTGLPRALMDAEFLTGLRTGAASGLATRLLATPGVRTAALFGAGGQARFQLEALRTVLPLDVIYVFARHAESADRFCRERSDAVSPCRLIPNPPRDVLRTCGVICTATTSASPVFADSEIGPGTHINGIGSFTPAMAEIPPETVCRAAVFVDQRAACLAEAGDLRQPLERGALPPDFHVAEIGEVLVGRAAGRRSAEAVTFFKSVGNAAQDLFCAMEVLERAEALGIGRMVSL
jgi:ornithine cyclodeaminase